MYYKLIINQQVAQTPKHPPYTSWEKECSKHKTQEDVLDRLEEIYRYEGGYNFIEGNEVYRGTEDGAEHIGYHYSYWTEIGDRSTGPKKGWVTDWITIVRVSETPAKELLNPYNKKKTA